MFRVFLTFLASCFLLPGEVVAGNDFTPPIVGQPAEFSRIAGIYRLSATVEPTEIFVGEPILLTVKITGSGPEKYQPQRRYLKLFRPEMEQMFFVEPLPKKDYYDPDSKTWAFFWYLRPKSADVTRVPALKLAYYHYDPGSIERYQNAYASSNTIKVKERPDEIIAPARMYQIVTGEDVLTSQGHHSLNWSLLLFGLLVPPIGGIVWYRLWRHLYPDETRQLQRRQSRAAKQALKELNRLPENAPTPQIVRVVHRYFQDRLGLHIEEPTMVEMGNLMQRAGYPGNLIHQTSDFLQRCHEVQFAPADVALSFNLRADATDLIESLESSA